jgi:hypothetical protein
MFRFLIELAFRIPESSNGGPVYTALLIGFHLIGIKAPIRKILNHLLFFVRALLTSHGFIRVTDNLKGQCNKISDPKKSRDAVTLMCNGPGIF